MTHVVVEEDIHKIQRRYENATRNLTENQIIPEPNKQKIRDFLAEYGVTHELSTARKLFYLQKLTTIAKILSATRILPTGDTTERDFGFVKAPDAGSEAAPDPTNCNGVGFLASSQSF